jgi:hypothetical protein
MARLDLVGERFGRLVVVAFNGIDNRRASRWLCKCDCGNTKVIGRAALKQGNTHSCGCIKEEREERHKPGMWKSPEYRTWIRIKTRCENKNTPYYSNYGGRGISVCKEWSESFEKFYADMGKRPSPQHSIERKDNNGDYEPSNCVWATRTEQQHNIRKQQNNTSGANGVEWVERLGKYRARITVDSKEVHIGCFVNFSEAVEARKEAEKIYWNKI